MLKKNRHRPHHHTTAPKPPSPLLWLMEAVLVSLGIIAAIFALIIFVLFVTNQLKAKQAILSATEISPTGQAAYDYKTIKSSRIFQLVINTKLFQAEALLGDNNKLIFGNDVFQQNDYSVVNVYKQHDPNSNLSQASIDFAKATYLSVAAPSSATTIDKLKKTFGSLNDLQLASKYYTPADDSIKTYKLVSGGDVRIGDIDYKKYQYDVVYASAPSAKAKQTDYITVANNRPYRVSIFQNIGYDENDFVLFETILAAVKYKLSTTTKLQSIAPNHFGFPSFMLAEAATRIISKSSDIQVVARNQPAVVKIATIYCSDFSLELNGVSQNFTNACTGGTGSGFIISKDGYVATNGHVVKYLPEDALAGSIALNNLGVIRSYLDFLVNTGILTAQTANNYYARIKLQDNDALSIVYGTLNNDTLKGAKISPKKDDYTYGVQLSNMAIKASSDNLKLLNFGDTIIGAKLAALDYNPLDLYENKGFTQSDVALLKLDKAMDYPTVSLGSIDSISAGSELMVIGFPGSAENELVDISESVPTSTAGRVSAFRNANNSSSKLIQTDVGIAPGNSGGPAFNDRGEVVGIATYGVTDPSISSSALNYMRDIGDLKKLLERNNIAISQNATGSQALWDNALENYSKAYYSLALSDFSKVKQAYPPNRLVDDFITKAESAKKDGREAIPPSTYMAVIAIFLVLIVVPGVVMFFVVRQHHKRRDAHARFSQMQNNLMPPATSANPVSPMQTNQNPPKRQVDMLKHAE